jgi:uncharacterized protein YicC (UPF0701 family)
LGNAAVIAIIGAFGALGILGVLFYVSTLAKNVYQIKIQMKDDLAYELDRLKDHVEKEMVLRQRLIVRDAASASDEKIEVLSSEFAGLQAQIKQDLSDIEEKVRKLAALQHALAAKKSKAKASAADESGFDAAFELDSPGRKAAK